MPRPSQTMKRSHSPCHRAILAMFVQGTSRVKWVCPSKNWWSRPMKTMSWTSFSKQACTVYALQTTRTIPQVHRWIFLKPRILNVLCLTSWGVMQKKPVNCLNRSKKRGNLIFRARPNLPKSASNMDLYRVRARTINACSPSAKCIKITNKSSTRTPPMVYMSRFSI